MLSNDPLNLTTFGGGTEDRAGAELELANLHILAERSTLTPNRRGSRNRSEVLSTFDIASEEKCKRSGKQEDMNKDWPRFEIRDSPEKKVSVASCHEI